MPALVKETSETRHLRGAAKSTRERSTVCPRCYSRPVGGYVQGVGRCCLRCANAICGVSDR